MSKTVNYYFKHHNEASNGSSLRALIDERDWETYSMFWIILELVSRWEKYDRRGYIEISERTLCRELNTNMRKIRRCLGKVSAMFGWSFSNVSEGFVSIFVPNFAEYQGSRFKKSDRSKIRDRDINKDLDPCASAYEEKSKEKVEIILDRNNPTKDRKKEVSNVLAMWEQKNKI